VSPIILNENKAGVRRQVSGVRKTKRKPVTEARGCFS
jgi:hypothetical protein